MENQRRATMPSALDAVGLENAQVGMVRRKNGQVSPASPTTAVVRRMVKAQPNVAVVHTVLLRDGVDVGLSKNLSSPELRPSSSSAARTAGELVVDPSNSRGLARRATLPANVADFAQQRRSSSAAALRDVSQRSPEFSVPALDGNNMRVLEPWEVADRSKNAVDFFKQAGQINRKARTIEDTELLLAEARRRRSESRSKSKESACQLDAAKGANRVLDALAHKAGAGQAESILAPGDSAEKQAPPERKMTLAERMGYGVKTTQAEDKFASVANVATAAVKFKKGQDVMIGVAAGNNTLKERLAKRRATIQ